MFCQALPIACIAGFVCFNAYCPKRKSANPTKHFASLTWQISHIRASLIKRFYWGIMRTCPVLRFQDSFSKTIPIWACVVNRAVNHLRSHGTGP